VDTRKGVKPKNLGGVYKRKAFKEEELNILSSNPYVKA
jgi:hypothetical protein